MKYKLSLIIAIIFCMLSFTSCQHVNEDKEAYRLNTAVIKCLDTGDKETIKSMLNEKTRAGEPSKGAYKLENCLDKIHNEFRKGNNVIVNISNLYPEHSKELINELTNDSKYSGKIIIINLFDDYIQVL